MSYPIPRTPKSDYHLTGVPNLHRSLQRLQHNSSLSIRVAGAINPGWQLAFPTRQPAFARWELAFGRGQLAFAGGRPLNGHVGLLPAIQGKNHLKM